MRPTEQWNRDMSDAELEHLAKSNRLAKGLAPWASWESERTGFGELFRRRALYPWFFPLMFSSDHYIYPLVTKRSNEVSHGLAFYATWNEAKFKVLQDESVRALHIKHPWLHLRERRFRDLARGQGTLLFWPHGHDTLAPVMNSDCLLTQLAELPSRYHPVSICVSSYEIQRGEHRELRKLGYPLTTIGDMMDQRFPSRFYKAIQMFAYTAGPHSSTHVYLSLEAGVPFLLFGRECFHYRQRLPDGSLGDRYDATLNDFPNPSDREVELAFLKRLENQMENVPQDLLLLCHRQMGYESQVTRKQFSVAVWRALWTERQKALRLYADLVVKLHKRLVRRQ